MILINKLKIILMGIGIGIMSLPSKILATAFNMNEMQDLYGPPPTPLYGVPPEQSNLEIIIDILKILVIPLILIVGLVIYVKKSKVSKKEKILVIVLSIILVIVLLYLYSARALIF